MRLCIVPAMEILQLCVVCMCIQIARVRYSQSEYTRSYPQHISTHIFMALFSSPRPKSITLVSITPSNLLLHPPSCKSARQKERECGSEGRGGKRKDGGRESGRGRGALSFLLSYPSIRSSCFSFCAHERLPSTLSSSHKPHEEE